MINILENEKLIVCEILKKYLSHHSGCEVRAFGSRVNGNSKKYSDLDLVIVYDKDLNPLFIESIRLEFQESDLPFRIDLHEWKSIYPNMQENISASGYEVIWSSNFLCN